MSKKTLLVSGISGIGKSTTISKLATNFTFKHLQASQMIKDFFQESHKEDYTSEQLRMRDPSENQKALINVLQSLSGNENCIFDAHTIIDTPNEIYEVPLEVFDAANPVHIIFLFDDPVKILARRSNDKSRARPKRTTDQLAEHQNLALTNIARIANRLSRPLTVLSTDQTEELQSLAQRYFTPI